MYVSSAVDVGIGFETVHEEGIGEIAGPPARLVRVGLGRAEVRATRDARMMVEVSILVDILVCLCGSRSWSSVVVMVVVERWEAGRGEVGI